MKDAGAKIEYRQLSIWDYPWMGFAEQRAETEVYGSRRTSENNHPSAEIGMLEKMVSLTNLKMAARKVKSNRGAEGNDGMTVKEIDAYLEEKGEMLIETILKGTYRPQPVKRVEIPKEEKGKVRKLGIPAVIDRVIQQAIVQELVPVFEPQFSEYSYGFRPGRSARQAIAQSVAFMNEGYRHVVSLDLERFFDTVNQSKMVELLSRTIKDGRVISLIHKYMRAGAVTGGQYEETPEGVSQGGPLSPMLSNIMLNELDQELEKRGHRFIRYADDCLILCKSSKSAERTKENITRYLEEKLFLKVNREKTKVADCSEIKYLGFGFYTKEKEIRIRVHPKSVKKMKDRIRELTKRSSSKSHAQRSERLNAYIRGWVNYYSLADMKSLAVKTDGWLRRKIRGIIWKQWKTPKTRRNELQKRGIRSDTATRVANSGKGIWRSTKTPVIHRALGNQTIKNLGYLTFTEQYQKLCVV